MGACNKLKSYLDQFKNENCLKSRHFVVAKLEIYKVGRSNMEIFCKFYVTFR